MKRRLPDLDAYRRFRNGTMVITEQRTFINSLEGFCEYFLRGRWPSLSSEETEDLAQEAIWKHLETFDSSRGPAAPNLATILHQMAHDLVKRASRRLTTSLEGSADKAGVDVPRFIEEESRKAGQSITVLDTIRLLESEEQVETFKTIYLRWNDLPPYPWKDTLYLYLQWWAGAGKTSTTAFIAYVKSVHGLKTRDQTIRDHINAGLEQLRKWVIHEEALPVGVRTVPVIAPRTNQVLR